MKAADRTSASARARGRSASHAALAIVSGNSTSRKRGSDMSGSVTIG